MTIPDAQTLREVVSRTRDSIRWERWQEQVRQTHYCERPIRLKGSIHGADGSLIYTTTREPDGVLLKACGNRRESVCKPCSYTYKGDAWQLVAAGLRGGKGVPETVVAHPMLFATFTAPSFGAVHQAHDNPGVCLPRRNAARCAHGTKIACWRRHTDEDQAVGQPICPECFDYDNAIIWNALAPELWRRTTIYIRRSLARELGISPTELSKEIRLSFLKVAEYQRRGVLHFHAVFRLDRAQLGEDSHLIEEPSAVGTTELEAAIRSAVNAAAVPAPTSQFREVRWGEQIDIAPISQSDGSSEKAAAYIAKYATKHTEMIGRQEAEAGLPHHLQRYLEAAHGLAKQPELKHLKLERAVQQLGYKGHWTSKSRHYSTTLTALRQARQDHATRTEPAAGDLEANWRYVGIGHKNRADELLSATAAQERIRVARIARTEVRGGRTKP